MSHIIGAGIAGAAASGGNNTKTVAGPTSTVVVTSMATTTIERTATPTKVVATHTATVHVTFTPQPKTTFSDGQYLVGPEIPAGTYHTAGGGDCYYALSRVSTQDGNRFRDSGSTGRPRNTFVFGALPSSASSATHRLSS